MDSRPVYRTITETITTGPFTKLGPAREYVLDIPTGQVFRVLRDEPGTPPAAPTSKPELTGE